MATIQVGTLATLQATVIVGIGSIADSRIQRTLIGGGATLSLVTKLTGTLALAAIGTGAMAVATVTGMGSAGVAVGDLIFGNPKAALSRIGLVGWFVPTTNVVNAYIMNPSDQGGGSLPAVGVDLTQIRLAG